MPWKILAFAAFVAAALYVSFVKKDPYGALLASGLAFLTWPTA